MIIYCCGFNGLSQLSTESTSVASSQFKVLPLNNIQDISFTWSCTVLLSGGDIYVSRCLEKNTSFLKKLIKPDDRVQFLKVACNETYALCTTEDGDCWQYFYNSGKWKTLLDFTTAEAEADISDKESSSSLNCNTYYPLENSNSKKFKRKIIQIDCGDVVNIVLDNCGQVYSIPSLLPIPGVKIKEVACGFEHCLMLDDFGRAYSWGSGMRGQLGCNMLETVDTPQEIQALSGLCVIHIASGGWHSAAITLSGDLYTWGWNNSGQLGFPIMESYDFCPSENTEQLNDQHERSIAHGSGIVSVLYHKRTEIQNTCTKDMVRDSSLQENEENKVCIHEKKRIKMASGEKLVQLSNRFTNTKSEKLNFKSSKVVCKWPCEYGVEVKSIENQDNEILIGSAEYNDSSSSISELPEIPSSSFKQKEVVTVLAVPRAVDFPSEIDVKVVAVSCGNRHSVVLTGDGTVWGCGWNAYAQLGISPNLLISTDCMTQLDIPANDMKICSVRCGGWNTAIFFNK